MGASDYIMQTCHPRAANASPDVTRSGLPTSMQHKCHCREDFVANFLVPATAGQVKQVPDRVPAASIGRV